MRGKTRYEGKVDGGLLWHVPPGALSLRESRNAFSNGANRLLVGRVGPL